MQQNTLFCPICHAIWNARVTIDAFALPQDLAHHNRRNLHSIIINDHQIDYLLAKDQVHLRLNCDIWMEYLGLS